MIWFTCLIDVHSFSAVATGKDVRAIGAGMRLEKFSGLIIQGDFLILPPQQAEQGTQVAEVTCKMGISEQTFYRWNKKYGGLMSSEVRKLLQLEEENARPRRLVADSRPGQGDAPGGHPK